MIPQKRVPAESDPYPRHPEQIPDGVLHQGHYALRFARRPEELEVILRLRYEIFNLELGEGLESSHATGLDQDAFDAVNHHMLVTDTRDNTVVGTYRLQTNDMAAAHRGFYSDDEFDLSALPREILDHCVEIGRACIHLGHRNRQVLFLLWKGLAAYLTWNQKRYLFGCSSLTSQDPRDGLEMLAYLEAKGHRHGSVTVPPRPGYECVVDGAPPELEDGPVDVPSLFRSYLRYGAKICGSPAIDRAFKTIDFLMLFDLGKLDERRYRLFFE